MAQESSEYLTRCSASYEAGSGCSDDITFVSSWNNYFIPSLLINKASKKTLPLLIAQLRSADFLKFDMGQVYMMIAFAIVPVIKYISVFQSSL